MKKISIRKLGIHSVAKMSGAIYALIGLIPGILLLLISLIPQSVEDVQSIGFIFGAGAIIALPIFYGIAGYIFGALFAWMYNLVAQKVGGLSLEIEEIVNTDTQD